MYEIYGTPQCAGCVQSEGLLKARKLPYVKKTVQQLLEIMPEAKSIPQIYKDGVYIGQVDQLQAHLKAA